MARTIASTPSAMTDNVALVGLGYWGPNLARNLAIADGGRLHTLCDARTDRCERLARQYPGTRTTSDYEAALAVDDVAGDRLDLRRRQLGGQGQGQHLGRCPLGRRNSADVEPEVPERALVTYRDWIVDLRVDALARERRQQLVATARPQDVEVKRVLVGRVLAGKGRRGLCEELRVRTRVPAPSRDPFGKMAQLHREDGRLQCVEAFTSADLIVLILAQPAVIAQLPDAADELRVAAGHAGSMLKVAGSMSTRTGIAPRFAMASAVATKVAPT